MDHYSENKDFQSVSDFFEGRSVFLTGASGFVGTVLLEILLRCCPGIASIYILLRKKGDLTPEQRKELIFEKKVFTILKDRSPEVLKKVHVVAGDMSKPELGMNDANLKCITEQVSIVYHCAANLSLLKPVRYLIEKNGGSTKSMIELCRKMKKFCVLVYTSTFYSNCNYLDFPVKEEVYRLPFHAQKFLDALKEENDDRLLEMVSMWKLDWPGWYPFSKCLSENILQDMASDLSVAIIRPSLVGCTWKSPIPGYLDENSAISKTGCGVGDGFIKVLSGSPNEKLNFIPADVVANMHLMAAWSIGTKKVSSPLVVNCTSTGNLHWKATEVFEIVKRIRQDFLSPKYSQSHKKVKIVKNTFLYWIVDAYEHFLPGIITDIILKIKGKKSRVLATYCFFHRLMVQIRGAFIKTPEFERANMDYLNNLLHDEDKKIFDNGIQNLKLEELLRPGLQEVPSYDWKHYHEIMIQYDWLISFIQYMVLIFGCSFIYWMTIIMFRQLQLI